MGRAAQGFTALVKKYNDDRAKHRLSAVALTLPDFTWTGFNVAPSALGQLELDTIRGYNGWAGKDKFGLELHEFRVAIDAHGLPVVDLDASGTTGKVQWERVPAADRPKVGDPNYVANVLAANPCLTARGTGDLAVIAAYFNPCDYRSREINVRLFSLAMARRGAPLFIMELLRGGQTPAVTGDVPSSQRRSDVLLWHKERLLNELIDELPPRFTKIAWVDADVLFPDSGWYDRASRALDKLTLVQMFDKAVLLDRGGRPDTVRWGVGYRVQTGLDEPFRFDLSHCGFAWAARRDWLQHHGLFDRMVVGGGDTLVALAAYGQWSHPFTTLLSVKLRKAWRNWATGAHADLSDGVGYVPQTIVHLYHGDRADRRYLERLEILRRHRFDPDRDIATDDHGVWRWTSSKHAMHREIASYFVGRREDGSQ